MEIKTRFVEHLKNLQQTICDSLGIADGKAAFAEDLWQRPGGGGGRTRVISHGNVFEKGGVNTSEVYGNITPAMRSAMKMDGHSFYATGLSLVIHPFNPFVPTVHANFRYFQLTDEAGQTTDQWFGGGLDLTPYYLFEDDVIHFHSILKHTCDTFDKRFYPDFKSQCDNYFVNTHRNNERRGVGGIFYDHCRDTQDFGIEDWFDFSIRISNSFIPAYVPLVEKRKALPFTQNHKHWQEIRRGRYVEFNLVHDRGTLFGLRSDGRTESILMSLPPTVRFEYDYQPAANTKEAELLDVCLHPRDWLTI